ncbi:MAG: BrnT family toxin [Campylobacterota bacterium]|nr:BrnT family toxin [Campylobacterota bacterium]
MEFECLDIENTVGFDWDDGNILKNEKKHHLKWQLIEEVFFNEPLLILEDPKHSKAECRCFALGKTDDDVKLFIVFTKRVDKIRLISARPMNKKERLAYENYS